MPPLAGVWKGNASYMKRLRFILFFLISISLIGSLLLLSSCEKKLEGDPFSRFRDNFEARFGLECNGVSSTLNCKRSGDTLILTFEAPETLSGYVFTCAPDSCRLSYDDVSVELTQDLARLPHIIKEIFSAENGDITSISAEKAVSDTNAPNVPNAPNKPEASEMLTRVAANNITYIFSADGAFRSAEGVVLGAAVKLSVLEINFNAAESEDTGTGSEAGSETDGTDTGENKPGDGNNTDASGNGGNSDSKQNVQNEQNKQ